MKHILLALLLCGCDPCAKKPHWDGPTKCADCVPLCAPFTVKSCNLRRGWDEMLADCYCTAAAGVARNPNAE